MESKLPGRDGTARASESRKLLLILFAMLALLGVAIVLWASVGDASVTAGTGSVYQSLENHGLGENVPLRNELYAGLLRLRWPWSVVQGLGLAVAGVAGAGFVVLWRGSRTNRTS